MNAQPGVAAQAPDSPLPTRAAAVGRVLASPAVLLGGVLRLAAPSGSGGLPRYAQADVEIAGVTIAADDAVLISPGAANRDPARFADPERFDATREPNLHLAFGHGAHYCIGAAPPRVELTAVFSALPHRFPTPALDADPAALAPRTDLMTGGLDGLPVRW